MNTPMHLLSSALAATGICWAVDRLIRSHQKRRKPVALSHPLRTACAEEVSFVSRDGRAHVQASLLNAPHACAAVVLVVGQVGSWGSDARVENRSLHVRTLAQALRARGITVLVARLRGHGESERHDVLGAVDYLLAQGYRSGRIGVLGASIGASAALLAAAEEPAVRAVVADSPRIEAHAGAERLVWPAPVLALVRWLGRALSGVDVGPRPVLGSLAALRNRAVLIVQGRGDQIVAPAVTRQIAQASGARLWLTASNTHAGTLHEALPLYITRVVDFFGQHLLPYHVEPLIVRADGAQAGLAPPWQPAAA
jgi:dienelactone hydrolase